MIDKNTTLQAITELSSHEMITKDELLRAFDAGSSSTTDSALTKDIGIAEILYYLGGIIVFIGIIILIYQNWTDLSSFSRISITLGTGIISYVIGMLCMQKKDFDGLGHAFQIISVLVLPIGVSVVFHELSVDLTTSTSASIISGILFGIYLFSYFVLRRVIFLLFAILFGTFFFFALTNRMIEGQIQLQDYHLTEYRVLIVGVTYLLLGHGFSKISLKGISWILYDFGIIAVLGSALVLGGWSPQQNIIWELLFPGIALGTLFLSIPLKSKGFLGAGTLFLMIYIGKITGEYFSEGMGWPLALIMCGLMMIGIGFLAFWVNQNYLKKVTQTQPQIS